MGVAVTKVQDDTSGTTRSVEGRGFLNDYKESGGVEGFERDLGIFSRFALGLRGASARKTRCSSRATRSSFVEGVAPDLLHVIPVGDDVALDVVLEGEDTVL